MGPSRLTDSESPAVCAVLRHARATLFRRVAQAAAAPDRPFADGFPALVVAVEAWFRDEERAMEALGIAGLRERRRNDALVLSALHRVAPAVEDGEVGAGRELVAALRDLLALRCGSADLVLARAALQGRPRPCPPRAAADRARRRSAAA